MADGRDARATVPKLARRSAQRERGLAHRSAAREGGQSARVAAAPVVVTAAGSESALVTAPGAAAVVAGVAGDSSYRS